MSFKETLALTHRLKQGGVTVGMISNHLVAPNLFDYCAEGANLRELVSHPSLLVVSQAVGLVRHLEGRKSSHQLTTFPLCKVVVVPSVFFYIKI